MDKPDTLERWLLAAQFSELHDSLRPGLTHLNWHSLGIQDFVNPVLKVLHMHWILFYIIVLLTGTLRLS